MENRFEQRKNPKIKFCASLLESPYQPLYIALGQYFEKKLMASNLKDPAAEISQDIGNIVYNYIRTYRSYIPTKKLLEIIVLTFKSLEYEEKSILSYSNSHEVTLFKKENLPDQISYTVSGFKNYIDFDIFSLRVFTDESDFKSNITEVEEMIEEAKIIMDYQVKQTINPTITTQTLQTKFEEWKRKIAGPICSQ